MKTKNNPYFAIETSEEELTADIYIFGDIASKRGGLNKLLAPSSDQSSYDLAQRVANIPEDYAIVVHINSNGGELKEGLGIYNVLKERDNVTTICEGFAASAASVIFCAGKSRIMQPASLLFIHQAWMTTSGNSDQLSKAAEDLKIITNAAKAAYKECGINIDDDALDQLLKNETWITPENALEMGFATSIADVEDDEEEGIQNSAMHSLMAKVTKEEQPGWTMHLDPAASELFKGYLDAVTKSEDLFALATKALNALDSNPEIAIKVKGFVDSFIATDSTPTPAQVENKGFFGFKEV